MENRKMMAKSKNLKGICVVEGWGLGKAYFVGRAMQQDSVVSISRQDVGDHIMRFNEVRQKARDDYRNYLKTFEETSSFDASILKIYEHILDDPAFIGQVMDTISTKLFDLETAVRMVSNDFIKRFNAAGTSYFKERSSDMVEICEKLISYIKDDDGRKKSFINSTVLIVLRAFTPSDIISYDISKVKAIISVSGGKTSHAAILARSYSIPVVSGIRNIAEDIRPGDEILVDANKGVVHVRPPKTIISKYVSIENKKKLSRVKLRKWNRPVYTKDGVHIEVLANISLPDDVNTASARGADGVGLVRTEYLLTNRKEFPDEKEQIEYYSSILKNIGDKECVIRMMDIGGDKIPEFFQMPTEYNPFMGWRAIRILLERKDIFGAQLRAIMKAGQGYRYKIMFPMVTTLGEWLEAKEFVCKTANELGFEKPDLGVLFEVPLAILEMESFVKEIEFASIGTNDLLQYLSAADRNNPKVNYLYNPIEPAFLRIIKEAIDVSKRNGIPLSICGEMAGNPANTLMLLGLGLTRFSVVPKNIQLIKEIISNVHYNEISECVAHLFAINSSEGISRWIKKFNKRMIGNLIV